MTKLYWRAVKKLPQKFVADGTTVTEMLSGAVVACNPKLVPMMFVKGRWHTLKLTDSPRPGVVFRMKRTF